MNNNSYTNNVILYNDVTMITPTSNKKPCKKSCNESNKGSYDEELLYINYNGLIKKDCKPVTKPCKINTKTNIKTIKSCKQSYTNDCDSDSDCISLKYQHHHMNHLTAVLIMMNY